MNRRSGLLAVLTLILILSGALLALAQKSERPPHGQDKMPGPALTPAEAVKKMTVPEGFAVEVVAAEPDIVNPVAMTFDERGRIWITESVEYPRASAGPGRDRIKVLEDTDGDGRIDKVTVFAEGLNIPSGIAVGHGGVWVANSPDILFYRIGPDGKAAGKPEVVVTGFGRTDTHELPNSLTWGPDGWLYGLNGVFNHSHVEHRGRKFDFTCALFRIHPKTREFQLFCEGTSNPWGVAFNTEGEAFVSACVIDHLWHLTETGYYHRQGGPYPPFTWKLDSIVKHRHQKAAYCGIHWFDSEAYPPEYRERLYMGNIHGGCINVDVLRRDGSTWFGTGAPDFLTANDSWFMPVAQKTGPDGCLYILDWYDRYHCYQDAQRDPRGIDREKGRLYRVRYQNTPRAPKFDLARESDDQLLERLGSPNVFFRDLAQRLLAERGSAEVKAKLEKLILDAEAPRKARMHALFSRVSAGLLDPAFHQKLLAHADPSYRAWGVRVAGNQGKVDGGVLKKVAALAGDPAPQVRLQVAIAARKLEGAEPVALLLDVLGNSGEDRLIPPIVWQNLHPLLEDRAGEFVARARKLSEGAGGGNLGLILPRTVERILARKKSEPALLVDLLGLVLDGRSANPTAARQCLGMLASKVQTGEVAGDGLSELSRRLTPALHKLMEGSPLRVDAALLAASWKDPKGVRIARGLLTAAGEAEPLRLRALEALVGANDPGLPERVEPLLGGGRSLSPAGRGLLLAALGRLEDPGVARVVLRHYASLPPDQQPKAIELLTQRTAWAKELVQAVADKKVPAGALNVNQLRRLLGSRDAALVQAVKARWGTVRSERNPEREKVVAEMGRFLRTAKGDAERGQVVFKNLCGQCHKIHGEGIEVGPDLTGNGRSTFDQLLSNVFDPSLVIGSAYQAVNVQTVKGQVLTGLLAEDSPGRVVLKLQGGKTEVIPRKDIEEMNVSKMSLMPEGLEKQLKPQELADLFAFLTLDRPPSDPKARRIPGAPGFR
jgi:putative membrane-bound dehydrogenase-like protein